MKVQAIQAHAQVGGNPDHAARLLPSGDPSYHLVIFDMDGTLADSFDFFIRTQNLLASKYHFKPLQPHEVDQLRQRSPREIMAHAGFPRWKLPLVARNFVRLKKRQGQEVHLFTGIERVLHDLHARGFQLAVVSSISVENCQRILGEDVCRQETTGKMSSIKVHTSPAPLFSAGV